MGNTAVSGNKLLTDGVFQLKRRLPPGWAVEVNSATGKAAQLDRYVRLRAPDRRVARLAVETKERLDPRGVMELAAWRSRWSRDTGLLVLARYLSPSARERLREADFSYLDLTGNARVVLREPGLFIETSGADVAPVRTTRRSRSLRGAKAGLVVRALISSREAIGVRRLAQRANVDAGYASRLLALLDREALIERSASGKVAQVDWPRLLRKWAEDAPLESRGAQSTLLEPRGLQALETKLRTTESTYAITGSLAAGRFAPVAPPRLATVYTDDAEKLADDLNLRPADRGANVLLIEAADPGIFEDTVNRDGLMLVSPTQVAADLLTSPGRGPAEAEALIEWMQKHEGTWRG